VQQTQPKAILNWQTFNVGRNTTLNFDQSAGGASASSWVALNRVNNSTAPSQILGQITAQGQVYVLNGNGIIFGPTAQVNTGALIASTAALADSQFLATGIYSVANSSGVLQPSFTGATAPVIVQPGAQITTNTPVSVIQDGGAVMLLGSSVQNAGQITTPAGQTVLAAGSNFTLTPGYSVSGVGSNGFPTGNTLSTTLGSQVAVTINKGAASGTGTVGNTGLIQATAGDVTMVGETVTQAGVALSTTSVSQRGTIHLLTATTDKNSSVTLAPGSLTYIAPDASVATALNAQRATAITDSAFANGSPAAGGVVASSNRLNATGLLNDQVLLADQQYESRIEITSGNVVDFQPGSLTIASGGQVAVSAGTPSTSTTASLVGRVLAETGAIIDVSGLVDVPLPASANNLEVNIQGFELRDAPVNRDTTLLNSSNVELDVRQLVEVPAGSYPTNRFYTAGGLLEVSGELSNVGHTIQEWSTLGGTVTLSSPQVVTQAGSEFNVAGGSVQYQAGFVKQSWLIASNGQLYNVNTAPANLTYTGIYNGFDVNHPRWNVTQTFTSPLVAPSQIYESAYTVGRDAGNLVIDANTTVFEGTVNAGVVQGPYQNASRTAGIVNTPFLNTQTSATNDPFLLPQSNVPLGGSLFVGGYNAIGLNLPVTSTVTVGDNNAPLAGSISTTTKLPSTVQNTTDFAATMLSDSGLAAVSIAANKAVTVASPVALAPGGQATLLAPSVTLDATLSARGGSVTFTNEFTSDQQNSPQALTSGKLVPGVTLGSGATIDTRGMWTNLLLDATDQAGLAYLNGGSVSLVTSGSITLTAGSVIDTSSGGALLANGSNTGGTGGGITLVADDPQFQTGKVAPVTLAGTLRSVGVKGGGKLTLEVPAVEIADTVSGSLLTGQIALSPGFFQQGFSDYEITGYGDLVDAKGKAVAGVDVASGTAIDVVEPVYQFTAASQQVPTGSDPAAAMTVVLPPTYTPNPIKATMTQRLGASLGLHSAHYTNTGTGLVIAGGGAVVLGSGSSITMDPGQTVQVDAFGSITVDAAITAPSGTISILGDESNIGAAPPSPNSLSFLLGLWIWLGPDSRLDTSALAVTALDQFGRPYGVVPSGGSIVIGTTNAQTTGESTTNDAFVFIRPGAVLDASGTSATIDPAAGLEPSLSTLAASLGGSRQATSNGGTISLASTDGIYVDGMLLAQSGGAGAAGGTLDLTLVTPPYALFVNGASQGVPVDIPDALRVPREIDISQTQQPSLLPGNLQPGDANTLASLPGVIGQAHFSEAQIDNGGFDNGHCSQPVRCCWMAM
jgi:filamentous hemagglutinin family protein